MAPDRRELAALVDDNDYVAALFLDAGQQFKSDRMSESLAKVVLPKMQVHCSLHSTQPKTDYRATQHLDSYILFTSKQKFPPMVGRYCSYLQPTQALSTFHLMSTEYRNNVLCHPVDMCFMFESD